MGLKTHCSCTSNYLHSSAFYKLVGLFFGGVGGRGIRGLWERPVTALCLSVTLKKILIPELQFLSFSGIENQEKAKPEARESGTHRLTIFNIMCFCWRIACRIRMKTLTCRQTVFVRGVSSIPIMSFCASIEKKKTHIFSFKNECLSLVLFYFKS